MAKAKLRLCSRCGLRLARTNNSRCSVCSRRQAEHVRSKIDRPSQLISTGCQIIDTVAILEIPFGYTLSAPPIACCPEVGRYWFDTVRVSSYHNRLPILRDADSVPDWICQQRRDLGWSDADDIWSAIWAEFELNDGHANSNTLYQAVMEVVGDDELANQCLSYTVNLMLELGVIHVDGDELDAQVIRETRAEQAAESRSEEVDDD